MCEKLQDCRLDIGIFILYTYITVSSSYFENQVKNGVNAVTITHCCVF